jgi:histone acetyltransferase (RNA polymerase elongator complex component)
MSMNIDTPADFQRALDLFCPYTKVFVMHDGEIMCEECAGKNAEQIKQAIAGEPYGSDWRAVACTTSEEECDGDRCVHCNEKL